MPNTTNSATKRVNDPSQEVVISAGAEARLLVEAGPGYGKTDVACARVAHLLGTGVAPSCLILLTFTRTAVRELRGRVAELAKEGIDVRGVEIRTIDSFAWRLRRGLLQPGAKFRGETYDETIRHLLAALSGVGDPDAAEGLREYLSERVHVMVDEAQDLVGTRARMIATLLRALPASCGWTVFMDPAQAIYDWTEADGNDGPGAVQFIDLAADLGKGVVHRPLTTLHRTAEHQQVRLLKEARALVLGGASGERDSRIRGMLFDPQYAVQCDDKTTETLAAAGPGSGDSRFILFRRRGDALMASSTLAGKGIPHQLRIGHMQAPTPAWIAGVTTLIPEMQWKQQDFTNAWDRLSQSNPLLTADWTAENAWRSLRFIAPEGSTKVDIAKLADGLAFGRIPDEFAVREIGREGPVIGTIHAAKGREADQVLLSVQREGGDGDSSDDEARVLYVGLSRPKQRLTVQAASRSIFSYHKPERAWRWTSSRNLQLEVGRVGDYHVASPILGVPDPGVTQAALQAWNGVALSVEARKTKADPDLGTGDGWRFNLSLQDDPKTPLGTLSSSFDKDAFEAGRQKWGKGPKRMQYARWMDLTTIAIHRDDPLVPRLPEPWRSRRIWLAPIIAGLFVAYDPTWRG